MKILGISAFYHDSAAAIIENGKVLFAAQEERFSRIKNDASFPIQAISFCLQASGFKISEIDAITFYDKPFLKFERILESYYAVAPRGLQSFLMSMPVWIKQKLFIKQNINERLGKLTTGKSKLPRIYFPEHHLSHAASAFYPSGFKESLIITLDGVGEYTSTSIGYGVGNKIKQLKSISFPHSLGLLYASFTYYLGFKINSGEYKVMGLSSYGDSNSEMFKNCLKKTKAQLIDVKDDGSFWMNQKYFKYLSGLKMCDDKKWEKLFEFSKREPDEPLEKHHFDLALVVQKITEEILTKIIIDGIKITGSKNLSLAGGVALNCAANGAMLRNNLLERIYVQPAAGDAGGAVGAALALYYLKHPEHEREEVMSSIYLGPMATNVSVPGSEKLKCREFLSFEELTLQVADFLASGKVIAWVQDRMEFGPRALGNRSILADPRNSSMKDHINKIIKNRESFRPFAPVVLEEDASIYFKMEGKRSSPYMSLTFPVLDSNLPAITHVDGTARIQTVNENSNKKLYRLIKAFKEKTNCSVLLNTSFNNKDEPMICSSEDAINRFLNSAIDYLVINNRIYEK